MPLSSSPAWRVVYDAANEPPSGLWFVVVGLLLLTVAVVRLRWHLSAFVDPAERRQVFRRRLRFLGFAAVWTIIASVSIIGPHSRLAKDLRMHRYVIVEGNVEGYQPANIVRKLPERWRVGEHMYEFPVAEGRTGFDHIGTVQPGSRVRIADVDGHIARLEVAP